jgi:tellurite resistance protein TerC
VVHRFVYLKYGLAAVLVFVGAKMMLVDVYKVPVLASLAVIAVLIGGAIAMSLRRGGQAKSTDSPATPGASLPSGAASAAPEVGSV